MGVTNRGKKLLLQWAFQRVSVPSKFYLYLCTNASIPSIDTNTLSELTKIATGNGWSGSFELTPGTSDFDVLTENDALDLSSLEIKDISIPASGGTIPLSGDPIQWIVLTDDNAVEANRNIVEFWSVGDPIVVNPGQTLVIKDLMIRAKEN